MSLIPSSEPEIHILTEVQYFTHICVLLHREFFHSWKRQWRVKLDMTQYSMKGMCSKALRICDDVGIFNIFKQNQKKEPNLAIGLKYKRPVENERQP